MRRGGVVVLQSGEGSLHGGGLLLGRMMRVPEISECRGEGSALWSMMAKKTMLSKARLLLTALEPSAMPSARACIHSPIVVLDSPFG